MFRVGHKATNIAQFSSDLFFSFRIFTQVHCCNASLLLKIQNFVHALHSLVKCVTVNSVTVTLCDKPITAASYALHYWLTVLHTPRSLENVETSVLDILLTDTLAMKLKSATFFHILTDEVVTFRVLFDL